MATKQLPVKSGVEGFSDDDLIEELEKRGYEIADEDGEDYESIHGGDLPIESIVDEQILERIQGIMESASTIKLHFLEYLERYKSWP